MYPSKHQLFEKALFVKDQPVDTVTRNDEAGITQDILCFNRESRESGQDII
jgi:hypothetical protein